MIDRLTDGVVATNVSMAITEVNAAFADMLGRTKDELIGQPLRAVFAEGVELTTGEAGVLLEQEVELRTAKGDTAVVRVTGRRDDVGLVLSVRADKSTAGIEIVSTVSHELRSPLTSVKGYTSLLLNRWDRLQDDQKKMMLEQVHHDADRVTRLITELLDISRLETGRLVLRRQMVDLPVLIKAILEKVTMEYPNFDVTLSFADDVPPVYADPDKVEQVLSNLLENACKYASPVGIRLAAAVNATTNKVEISVSDEGEGIPSDALPKVFTKFFRRAEGRPTGSGLGLWISRGLVEAHGGNLTAESIPGKGSTFRFTLPVDAFENIHGTDDDE